MELFPPSLAIHYRLCMCIKVFLKEYPCPYSIPHPRKTPSQTEHVSHWSPALSHVRLHGLTGRSHGLHSTGKQRTLPRGVVQGRNWFCLLTHCPHSMASPYLRLVTQIRNLGLIPTFSLSPHSQSVQILISSWTAWFLCNWPLQCSRKHF